MTAIVRLRALAARARRLVSTAVVVAAAALVTGGSPVQADSTVVSDDAGGAAHISLIGDSTLAGVRWYGDYGALERFNFVFNSESCRRTIVQSCFGREGYRSANVITTMRKLEGELGEVLVVMSGYNDPLDSVGDAIIEVVDEARRQGVGHVVWLSLRTSDDVDYSDPQDQSSVNTFREYNEQLHATAVASGGYLQVADWATYSTGSSAWFEHDGVHLTERGVDAVTTFIADTAARVLAGEDVSPSAAPWTLLMPGAEGETVTAVQQALIAAGVEVPGGPDGVFGNDTMVAVAEYQRRTGGLQVTGAVDVATARALGVYHDPAAADAPTTAEVPTTTAAATPVGAPGIADVASSGSTGGGTGLPRWSRVAAGAVVIALAGAAAVVVRRRYVVAQRTARRWARVHPATSPHRSVADMRRAGLLPSASTRPHRIYDHEVEESLVAASSHGDPRSSGGRTSRN